MKMRKKRAKDRHRENEQARKEDRQKSALTLRTEGLTYDKIANILGCSVGTVSNYINASLADIRDQTKELAQEVRDIEIRRLDDMLFSLRDKIAKGNTTAIQTALKIQERRAKLLGLDAPTPTNVEPVPDTIEVIDPYEDDDQA